MHTRRVATFLFLLGLAGAAAAQGYGYAPQGYGPGYGSQGYGPQGPPPPYGAPGWNAPPQELREFQRQGFADGIQGAQRDFENHRIWNVRNRDEYRHPPVPRNVRNDYRDGFQRGYYAAVQHFQGGRGPYGHGYGPR